MDALCVACAAAPPRRQDSAPRLRDCAPLRIPDCAPPRMADCAPPRIPDCATPADRASLPATARRSREAGLDRDPSWETLLARANAGDGAAFARFLTEISPSLRALIRARGTALPAHLHEDILQEVLLAIHLKRGSWRQGSPVRPWLYAVARYKIVDAFRRRNAAIHLPIDDYADSLEQDMPDTPLAARDADRLLDQIDHRSAALVRAIALDGDSAEEAGGRLGLSAGATRVALHRALKRLSQLAERMNR